jgi:hypothetical protein
MKLAVLDAQGRLKTQQSLQLIRGNVSPAVCQGRLTLTSGTPVTTADVTAAATLYFTPYKGNQIGLFDGISTWTIYGTAEISISVAALTANTNYAVYIYDNAGTPTLELQAWTNATTRATALAYQDGILVKSGDATRRYLGDIRITNTAGQTEDSGYRRFVWNYYNRISRALSVVEATNNWTYATATWRSANNSTSNRVEFITGVMEEPIAARVMVNVVNSSGNDASCAVGVGLDSTSVNSALITMRATIPASGGIRLSALAEYYAFPAAGYHYLQWLEISPSAETFTFTANASEIHSGMIASVIG